MAESADVVRRAYEAFNAGDIDGMVELCDPGVEFRDVPLIPGSGWYRGREGIRRWAEAAIEPIEDLRFEFGEAVEAGDAVMVETRATGRGRGSGAEVDWTFFTVWRVQDGLITYHHGYEERAAALEALAPAAR